MASQTYFPGAQYKSGFGWINPDREDTSIGNLFPTSPFYDKNTGASLVGKPQGAASGYPTWGENTPSAGSGTVRMGSLESLMSSPEYLAEQKAAFRGGQPAGGSEAGAPRARKTIGETMAELGLGGKAGGTTAPTATSPAPSQATPARPDLFGGLDLGALFQEWLNPTSGPGGSTSTSKGTKTTVNPWATQGAGLVTGSLNANTAQLNQALEANRVRYAAMKEQAGMNPGVGGGGADSMQEQIARDEANSAAQIQQQFANQQQTAQAGAGRTLLGAGQQQQAFEASAERADAADRAQRFNQLMSMLGAQENRGNRAEDVDFRNTQADREQGRYELSTAMNEQRYQQGLMTADEERAYERQQKAQGIARGEADKAYAANVRRYEYENKPGQVVQIGGGGSSGGGGGGGVYDGSSWSGANGGGYKGMGNSSNFSKYPSSRWSDSVGSGKNISGY